MAIAICRAAESWCWPKKKGIFALTHAVRATKPCLLSGLGAAALPSSKQVARAPGSVCLVNVSTLKLVALFS